MAQIESFSKNNFVEVKNFSSFQEFYDSANVKKILGTQNKSDKDFLVLYLNIRSFKKS